MARIALTVFAILGVMALLPTGAQAQVITRPVIQTPGPTVSPYLNLLRPGSSTALNYYGLVRPQFAAVAGFQAVQQQFGQLQYAPQPGSVGTSGDLLTTGHASSFMNLGGYFMNTNVGGNSPRATTPARTQPQSPTTPPPRAR